MVGGANWRIQFWKAASVEIETKWFYMKLCSFTSVESKLVLRSYFIQLLVLKFTPSEHKTKELNIQFCYSSMIGLQVVLMLTSEGKKVLFWYIYSIFFFFFDIRWWFMYIFQYLIVHLLKFFFVLTWIEVT